MASTPVERLEALGLALPELPAAAGQYVPVVRNGNMIITSGQLPLQDGVLTSKGLLGRDLTLEQGQHAAKWCAMNVLAQLAAAADGLENIKKVLKITVFVASSPDFTDQHLVANGASGLIGDVLGEESGSHARSAVGMAVLPLNAPVEVEAIAIVNE